MYLCDEAGNRLGKARLPEGIEGIGRFHELIAGHAGEPADVVVGIETDRGLWVQALVEAGYRAYRDQPSGGVALPGPPPPVRGEVGSGRRRLLAELVRTDRHNHRPVAGDSDLGEGIKVLARAHQNLIWDRTRATNRLRCALREYFPAALDTFAELADRDTLSVLAVAPIPSPPESSPRPGPDAAAQRRTPTQHRRSGTRHRRGSPGRDVEPPAVVSRSQRRPAQVALHRRAQHPDRRARDRAGRPF